MSSKSVIGFDGMSRGEVSALVRVADRHPETSHWRLFVRRGGLNGKRTLGPRPPHFGYLVVRFRADEVPTGFRSLLVGISEEDLIQSRQTLGTYNQVGRPAPCSDLSHALHMAFLA